MKQSEVYISSNMKKIYNRAQKIASFPTTVLIEGETGVGKEVIANFIHRNSPRKNMPFIKINCGAIPESLLDSELFGYEKGAFTGANRDGNPGFFESANKGSLLLDEIGELPFPLQVKLLRVLQEHEVRRIGGSWSKPIDVRIIASTNKDLLEAVKSGTFRMDLYYRLNIVNIKIPPLRKRKDDIIPLIEYFLEYLHNQYGKKKFFDKNCLSIISNLNLYGNIRELKNIVESAYILSDTECMGVDSLPEYLNIFSDSVSKDVILKKDKENKTLKQLLNSVEREAIIKAVSSTTSLRKAAIYLDISNATLLRKIKYHELKFNKQH